MTQTPDPEQLALLRAAVRSAPRPKPAGARAEVDPVAVVAVDTGLAHLDRPFDYLVPESLDAQAQPGVRVKVRFSGRDLDGFIIERRAESDHDGRLHPLRTVVSPEPVLTPQILAAAQAVAARYAGPLGDVLRLAIPPRHATAEKALAARGYLEGPLAPIKTPGWEAYTAGPAFLSRVALGEAPGATLLAAPCTDPAEDWPALLAGAAAHALAAGRGSIVILPEALNIARVDAELLAVLGRGRHVRLTADQGPQARYTAYLKVLRGHVKVVVGTRAAAFAPVHDLGLLAWWDDGDESLIEQRAPYPHVREVLRIRARLEGAALLSAGFARSVAIEQWVTREILRPLVLERSIVRRRAPRVEVAGEGIDVARDPAGGGARLSTLVFHTMTEGLTRGPVLVQVPRRGYLPALSCQECRRSARCAVCAGPLGLPGRSAVPACRWCGAHATSWACPQCGSTRLRSAVVGARRTAEELGRAFPGVPVTTSGSGPVLDRVDERPRLVISTPGAEPVAAGGYAAAALLDAWALLDRPDLGAAEEALRRWLGAAALVRGGSDGGRVVLSGAPGHVVLPAVEALVRWDPVGFAARELREREALGLPPAQRMAALTGTRAVLLEAQQAGRWPESVHFMGPLPIADGRERLLVTCADADAEDVTAQVAALHVRSLARRDEDPLHVRIDPPDPSR